MDYFQQKYHVKYWSGVRHRQKRLDRLIAREYVRRDKMVIESMKEWKERYRLTELASNEAELKMMCAEEEMKEADSALIALRHNQSKVRRTFICEHSLIHTTSLPLPYLFPVIALTNPPTKPPIY